MMKGQADPGLPSSDTGYPPVHIPQYGAVGRSGNPHTSNHGNVMAGQQFTVPIHGNASLPTRSGVHVPPKGIITMSQGQVQTLSQFPGGPPGMYGDTVTGPYGLLIPPDGSINSPMPTSGIPVQSNLSNVHVSSSNFNKAINFEALSYGRSQGVGSDDSSQVRLYPSDPTQNQPSVDGEVDECSQYSDEGEYADQSYVSENNTDMMEQQQAKAQAQLLDRFKQLREWQMSQQEILIRQQQDQLTYLKEEQSRVKKMMIKERESQWGNSGQQANLAMCDKSSSHANGHPPVSHHKPPRHPNSTLPHAIAQSTLALARMNNIPGVDAEAIPRPSTPVQLVKGRPLPDITSGPSTPLEYTEHGNPYLDSDTTTIASGTPLEDGIARLADSASEAGDQAYTGPSYFQSQSASDNAGMDVEKNDKKNSEQKSKLGAPIPFPPIRGYEEPPKRIVLGEIPHERIPRQVTIQPNFTLPPNLFPRQLHPGTLGSQTQGVRYPNYAFSMPSTNTDMTAIRHLTQGQFRPPLPNGHQAAYIANGPKQVLDYREVNGYIEESVVEENLHCAIDEGDNDNVVECAANESPSENSEFDEEDESKDITCDGTDPPALDDIPVLGNHKTFQQLLEEELQKEEERLKGNSPEAVQQHPNLKSSSKKSFLKRGEGLARFGRQNQTKKSGPTKQVSKQQAKSNHVPVQSNKKSSAENKASVKKQTPVVSTVKSTKTTTPAQTKTLDSKKASKSAIPMPSKTTVQSSETSKLKKPADSTGEISFQRCIQERAKKEAFETKELEEFEILEEYADHNASFMSSVSAVNRVLDEQKSSQQDNLSTKGTKAAVILTEEDSETENSSESETEDSEESDSGDDTLHDTPSPQHYHDKHTGAVITDSDIQNTNNKQSASPLASLKTIHRKVSSMGNRSPSKSQSSQNVEYENRALISQLPEVDETRAHLQRNAMNIHVQNRHTSSSEEDVTESESESDDEINVKHILENARLGEQKVPDQDVHVNQKEQQLKFNGASNDSKMDPRNFQNSSSELEDKDKNLDDSDTEKEKAPTVTENNKTQTSDIVNMDFGDDEAWDEDAWESETAEPKGSKGKSTTQTGSNGPIIKTKVYSNQQNDQISPNNPPTSKLVAKLFPKLKPKKPKPQPTPKQDEQLQEARQAVLGNGVQSKALRDKLLELEREIERFRRENTNLENMRKEREEGLTHLRKEMSEFDKQKSEELQKIQEFKKEESKKLAKEKRVFEQYQKAARSLPDRKDRDEIDSLKKQLSDVQDELKRKEQRWTASTTRLRNRVEQLEQENSELKEEINIVEKKRLEAWQQKDTTTSKKEENSHRNTLPQPQTNGFSPHNRQPGDTTSAQRDHMLRLSGTTNDADSEQADVHPQINAHDHVQVQAPPKATSSGINLRHSTSPKSPFSQQPVSPTDTEMANYKPPNQSTLPRKTAVAANINNVIDKGDEKYDEMQHVDGKIERIYTNGAREILFSNGTRKQVSADGQSIIVSFFNGDIKQILPDQRVVYYYADVQTSHTTYPDGLEIIQFPNGQSEKHYPDGTREITFPDQIIKYLFPTGIEESIFPDGTVIRVEKTGDKVMEFPNGQREIHTAQYKKREYPDGTVKTVYPDGRQETRYSSGRIRVKDKHGNIIVDRRM